MPAKEIVVNGITYVKKPVKRVFKAGEWVRVYSKARADSTSSGPKAGDFGRVHSSTSYAVTVDFGVLNGCAGKVWRFYPSGDAKLTSQPSTSLLRHCKKS